MSRTIKEMILSQYRSEAECARALGWERQRLNKITKGIREPSVFEINEIAKALSVPVGDLVPLFLHD